MIHVEPERVVRLLLVIHLCASGARLALTVARELVRRKKKYAVVSLCIGVGQGLAMVIENVSLTIERISIHHNSAVMNGFILQKRNIMAKTIALNYI